MERELEFAIQLARQAGEIINKYFYADQQVKFKADKTFVTIADKMVNQHVIKEIQKAYPDHGVIGEEASTDTEGKEYIWVCDPIDGTKAFVWGVPTAMFSLALVHEGRPIAAVAYSPFLDRMYTAVKGEGAYCNKQKIHVSNTSLEDGILAVTADVYKIQHSRSLEELVQQNIQLAVFSGFVYKGCLTAIGKVVGYVEDILSNHDIVAIDLLITEAGGKVTTFDNEILNYNKPMSNVVMSNGVVHNELLKIAKSYANN